MNIYRPGPAGAIGNMSLCMATHTIVCFHHQQLPKFHKDVLAYERDKIIKIPNVVDTDVPVDNGYGRIYGFIHLQFPKISEILRDIIQPTNLLQQQLEVHRKKLVGCVAGFHIRRGTLSEDSKHLGFLPFASNVAVESMIQEANRLDQPVFILSDSLATKKLFQSRVPKAVSLELPIGFTADEHSQKVTVENEKYDVKMNSFIEWFLLSEMPRVYMTAGGINGRNVDETVIEGITSTFGYSAALYGGTIPWYVFNDGFIHLPDGTGQSPKRYQWSDMS